MASSKKVKLSGYDATCTTITQGRNAMYKEYTRPLEQQIDTEETFSRCLMNERTALRTIHWSNTRTSMAKWSVVQRHRIPCQGHRHRQRPDRPRHHARRIGVSIISHTCWQWTALDVAIMSIGALTVPVYETNSSAQVKMIFNDANVKMAFAEDDAQRDKIESSETNAPILATSTSSDLARSTR